MVGGTPFEITGDASVTGDPKEDIKGKYHDDNGKEFDATASVDIEKTETGEKSSGTGTATDKDGKVIKTGKVTDFVSLQNPKKTPWEINFLEAPPPLPGIKQAFDFGFDTPIGPTEFQGSFTQTISEPSTLTLVSFGIVGLIGFCVRRHNAAANAARSTCPI